MSRGDTGRAQRHRAPIDAGGARAWRYALGACAAALVLVAGLVIGFGDFFGRPQAGGQATGEVAQPVRMSMAGFDPGVITARAGSEVTLELWTTDAAPHLQGGVHTLISDELGLHFELPAESRRTVTFSAPSVPGDYDIYCDTCCGGKASPTMHGKLRVVA